MEFAIQNNKILMRDMKLQSVLRFDNNKIAHKTLQVDNISYRICLSKRDNAIHLSWMVNVRGTVMSYGFKFYQ